MFKKYLIFCATVGAIIYYSYNFIDSGKCQELIAKNADQSWAPAAMYYLGNYFIIIQKNDRAEEIYKDILEIFPAEKYYEISLYKYYYLEAENGSEKEAIKRGEKYLKEFPDTERAELTRKRIETMKKF
ncbi:MAG: hypothetical protein PF545_05230 [Elusimicrobia bacterium]|jgi:outer membrane protein assembly factor BamD (BamD/ComL family)|nr:hypothetical protein [Elusimicrobiota bacterium]